MKTLLVLRHAKTQPDAPRGDHARRLTDRGHRDAWTIGNYIRNQLGVPDAIVTSDATRARQTAEIVAEAIGIAQPPTLEPRIYGEGPDGLLAVVRALPDAADTVLIIGHNPGFSMLAAALTGTGAAPLHLPTAGLAIVDLATARWTDLREGGGHLRAVVTPKTLRG
jgi:phosphohistidine phosphatase